VEIGSVIVGGPNAGMGTIQMLSDRFVYTPPQNFQGEDRFHYHITESSGIQAIGVVSVTVAPPEPPEAPKQPSE
jgi:hypothetical protein